MRIAISIPDDLFHQADRLARRTSKSRSQLFGEALREYLARHADDEITEAMNKVAAEVGEKTDDFVSGAACRVLEQVKW